MEISIVLSNNNGTLSAVLGQYISTAATDARAAAAAAAASAAQAAAFVGTSLLKANNLSDVSDPVASRNNLGLGSVATLNVVPIANGGTGATSQNSALTNVLGSSAIPIANGGTGSTTQSAALTAILGSSSVPVANGGTGGNTQVSARTGLGLGTAATQNTGTSGATVPLLNGPNTWSAAQTFSIRPTFNSATPWDSANLPSPAQTTGAVFTGAITPSQTAGIVGTTTNNNASAGSVGEYPVPGSASGVAYTSGSTINITSISLTAGDWDVEGTFQFASAAGVTVGARTGGISSTSATFGGFGTYTSNQSSLGAGLTDTMITPKVRMLLSATTTVYLVGSATYSGGTSTAQGFLRARRIR